ncbi:MAG: class I SAM-dependent methyltransferase [Acidimicrobiales bacterium]
MPELDELAEIYDETRGGEARGEEYAADVTARLPAGEDPVLEVGVGTGVVALGLVRRGHRVVGLDISSPMLSRARVRLGPAVALGDAVDMPLAAASVAHAVSVWVVHAVAEPVRLFSEVARVLRPGGRYVVCTTQRPTGDDVIGQIIHRMGDAVDARRGGRPRGSEFLSSPSQELDAIARRAWPALRALGAGEIEDVTRPAMEALRALPEGDYQRRMTAEMLVLHRPVVG